MFLIMYCVLMDMLFSVYHHSIQISMSLAMSGAMSSNGSDNRMSRTSWIVCGNCEQWFAEISDTDLEAACCHIQNVHFTEGLLCSVSGSSASWDNS
jgi:hypothetical protein